MSHSVLFYEAPDLPDTLIRPADDEAVLHQPVQVRRDRGVDEGMAPAAGVFLAVRDHDVRFGELPSLSVGLGDDQIAGQGPLRDRLAPVCGPAVVEESLLALEESLEIGGGVGGPAGGAGFCAAWREGPPGPRPH